jgi:hypothetical protein
MMDRWLTCANRALEFSAVGSEEDVQFSSSRAPRHRLDFQPRVFEQLLGRHAIFGLPLQHAPDKLEKHFIGYPATWQHCQVRYKMRWEICSARSFVVKELLTA